MNTQLFFKELNKSLFNDRLNNSQWEGIKVKLNAFKEYRVPNIRWCAYMLATSYHETAHTMRPVEEFGKGRGKPYGRKLKYSRRPYTWPDKIYYGRGDVQLTWYENYEKMGIYLDIPLLVQPELALRPDISARIMVEGMTKGVSMRGDFTGVSLETYFNSYNDDPIRARRVVNGLDQANRIADVHYKFLNAMEVALR